MKKKIIHGEIENIFEKYSELVPLRDAIELLEYWEESLLGKGADPDKIYFFLVSGPEYFTEGAIKFEREETEKEYNKRMEIEKKKEATEKEKDRIKFEQLKKKHGW